MTRWIGLALLLVASMASAQTIQPSPQALTAQFSSTCTATTCATWAIGSATSLTISVSGSFSGTITWEASSDGGNTYFTATLINLTDRSTSTTTTGTGQFAITNSGITHVQARMTAFSTGGANVWAIRGYGSPLANPFAQAIKQALSISLPNLTTTSTDALTLTNQTAATAGVPVQMSPRVKWCGTAYNSVSTLSETNCFFAEVLPSTVAGTTTASYKIGYIAPGGAVNYPVIVNSDGSVSFATSVNFGAGSVLSSGAAARIFSPGVGEWNFEKADGSTGIGIDVSTDNLLKIRTRAQTGDASLTALALGGAGTGTSVANVGSNSCGTTAATIAGNQVSGVITVGTVAGTQCRVTFTTAAPVARDCTVTDSTTTIATRATYVDTSNTDFLGAFVAGDKVTYQCTVR